MGLWEGGKVGRRVARWVRMAAASGNECNVALSLRFGNAFEGTSQEVCNRARSRDAGSAIGLPQRPREEVRTLQAKAAL